MPRKALLQRELAEDPLLLLQFVVAERLGMTLTELRERMTEEELLGWAAFYELRKEHERVELEKARQR